MLKDWLDVRKHKRSKVTKTAWNKINKTLMQVKESLSLSPIEAFETMVTNGWLSMELKYFLPRENNYSAGKKNESMPIDDSGFI